MRTVLVVVLVAFLGLTAVALAQHGLIGIIAPHFQSFGGGQVFADLVIALSLILVWIWRDARATGRNPWPWLLLTVGTGSIGPLIYLITRTQSGELAKATG